MKPRLSKYSSQQDWKAYLRYQHNDQSKIQCEQVSCYIIRHDPGNRGSTRRINTDNIFQRKPQTLGTIRYIKHGDLYRPDIIGFLVGTTSYIPATVDYGCHLLLDRISVWRRRSVFGRLSDIGCHRDRASNPLTNKPF